MQFWNYFAKSDDDGWFDGIEPVFKTESLHAAIFNKKGGKLAVRASFGHRLLRKDSNSSFPIIGEAAMSRLKDLKIGTDHQFQEWNGSSVGRSYRLVD